MREELDNELCEKYPEIFRDRHAPVTQTPMGFGFECGDGWFDLIDALCKRIQNYLDWERKYPPPHDEEIEQVVAAQVKEKFGGMRFYFDGGNDVIRGMVMMAEEMSYSICEECGNKGRLRGSGWVITRCDEHYTNDAISYEEQLSSS
jgi:hypothetical protein